MVRIDSYLALLAIVVAVVALVCVAEAGRRRAAVTDALALLGVAAVPMVLGWLDVTRLSSGYYRDQHHNIIAGVGAGSRSSSSSPRWRSGSRGARAVRDRLRQREGPRRDRRTGQRSPAWAAVVVLLSRPLWMTGRYKFNHTLVIWQGLDGVAADGTRSYNERTVLWLVDYLGWPTVALGMLGYCLLIIALVRRRAYPLIGMLTLGLAMSAVYLWNAEHHP